MTSDIQYTAEGMVVGGQLITWNTIDAERNQIRFANSVLVRISFRYGRSDFFGDQFIIDRKEWEELNAEWMGREIYMGEIAGKHSQVSWTVDASDIEVVEDLKYISDFHASSGWKSGNVDVRSYYEDLKADGLYEE